MALLTQLDNLFSDLKNIPGLSDADKGLIERKRAELPSLLEGILAAGAGSNGENTGGPDLRAVYDALASVGVSSGGGLAPFETLTRALNGATALRGGVSGSGGEESVAEPDGVFPSAEELDAWGIALDRLSPRVPGTESMDRTADYLTNQLESFGIETWTEPINFRGVFFREWSFELHSPEPKAYVCFPHKNVAFGDIRAEIADVGRGGAADYEGVDVRGKIVLVNWGVLWDHEGPCAARQRYGLLHLYDLAYAHGAAAMAGYFEDTPGNALKLLEPGIKPIGGSNVFGPSEAGPAHQFKLPALNIGREDAIEIKEKLKEGRVTARLAIAGVRKVSTTRSVIGFLPGRSAKTIAVAAHSCTAFEGAVCDTVGVVGALALAKRFASLPIEKRDKSLLFFFDSFHVWGNCCQTANTVLRNHPTLAAEAESFLWLDHISDGRPDTERILIVSDDPVVWPLTALAMAKAGLTPLALPVGRIWSFCATGAFERRGIPTITMQAFGNDVLTTEDLWVKFDPEIVRRDVLVQADIAGALLSLDVRAGSPGEPIGGCGSLFTGTEEPSYPPGESYAAEPDYPLYAGGGAAPVEILATVKEKAAFVRRG